MSTCFVMQPFDGGPFDKRYNQIYAPAIRAAGIEPYRVDEDPKVSVPIEDIERGIRQSRICLAEITLDNPNVWFELGFAIACNKEVVLICADSRATKFPFDVQHRTIIKYGTGSPSDFESLQKAITSKILAYMDKSEALATVSEISQLATPTQGFADHEVVALAAIAQNLSHVDDHASAAQVQRDMEANGYTRLASTFALKSLTERNFVSGEPYNGFDDQYYGYRLTEAGWAWVLANQDRFSLRKPMSKGYGSGRAARTLSKVKQSTGFDDMDDDIPP